jgi:hypothetical protein
MPRRFAWALGAAVAAGVLAGTIADAVADAIPTNGRPSMRAAAGYAQPARAAKPKTRIKTVLQLKYRTKTDRPCTVLLNYPRKGVKGNAQPWTVPAGKAVVWRYNVNKRWAVISYPARRHQQPPQGGFPWWGFTERSCLDVSIDQPWKIREYLNADGKVVKRKVVKRYPAGRPVPSRLRKGRSRETGSNWRHVYLSESPAPIVHRRVRTDENATLRDRHNFVIGNVPKGWRVNVTGEHRKHGHWVKVQVPNARRWGYLERRALPDQLSSLAQPAATDAAQSGAPAQAATPSCHWKVTWPAAGVYEDPTRSQPPIKTKHSGDVVGPHCTTAYNANEHETYVQVQTDKAVDGIGWMRSAALKPA